ncbi:MAG TPA: DUF4395 family protein [Candidatus Dormibacteraeota bacterium]|nr:DUF4395 family protein [Candidatus Dormibacteraeota bacterium]
MSAIPFDRSVLKVNQVILMAGLLAGYAFSLARPLASVALPVFALMMLHGAAVPSQSLPRVLYLRLLKPRGLVRPRVAVEDPAPHRFAQLVGGVFLAAGSLLALAGAYAAAWTLGWVVVALAFLNFAFDVCVGCIMYAQLVRVGLLPLHRTAA